MNWASLGKSFENASDVEDTNISKCSHDLSKTSEGHDDNAIIFCKKHTVR